MCIHMLIAALFTVDKIWRQPGCSSVDEWIKERWYIYIMDYYSAIEKNKLLPSATILMDLEGIVLGGVSHAEKNKCHMISLICGI